MSKMSFQEAGKLGAAATKQVWIARYQNNPKFCFHCSERLPYEKRKNKFCNQSCASSCNNVGICRRTKTLTKQCSFCEKKINKNSREFCSPECHQKSSWDKRKDKVIETGRYDGKATAKRYLTETNGHCCSLCGITEWMGQPLTLILDHINGHADDWSVSNCRLICSNCDTLTPTYKGCNKGNGRHNRRQRYQDGKSY